MNKAPGGSGAFERLIYHIINAHIIDTDSLDLSFYIVLDESNIVRGALEPAKKDRQRSTPYDSNIISHERVVKKETYSRF